MGNFDQLIDKQGETVSRYVHSFESSRDTTTNLKESQWAAAVDLLAIIRSQPSFIEYREEGIYKIDVILALSKTAVVVLDVIKWANKYYDVVQVESMYWKGNLEYYKSTCQERLEFIGN